MEKSKRDVIREHIARSFNHGLDDHEILSDFLARGITVSCETLVGIIRDIWMENGGGEK